MASIGAYIHLNSADRMESNKSGLNIIKLSSLTIFLPHGVDATSVIDAFNAVMGGPVQPVVVSDDAEQEFPF